MALKEDVKVLNQHYKDNLSAMRHNAILFDIFEGNLLPYVLKDLKSQLSENSYNTIQHRVPPINVLKKVVDKQSKIYVKMPRREIVKGKKAEQNALGELLDKLEFDVKLQDSNEIFNLAKSVAIEPFLDEGKPSLRVLPPDRFFVYSASSVNPMKPTHFVKCMGKMRLRDGSEREIFHAYTDEEFLIYDDREDIRHELMAEYENRGVNEFKKIPFVYVNRSKYSLIPKCDTDTLQMTKLIPILLADCNFATMFQSFSIIYGIDVDDENLMMAPNAFWRFKSDKSPGAGGESKPQIGVIKPEADTDKILNLIKAEISMWLNTKNIKPGAIGSLTVENAASGISKMIDESDTSEDRSIQAPIFAKAEQQLMDLIVNYMHPIWLEQKEYEVRDKFGPNLIFKSHFPEQKPIVDSSKVVDDEIKKLDKGLTTRKLAIKAIEPDLTEEEVEERVTEIEEERKARQEDQKNTGDNIEEQKDPDEAA